MTSEETKAKVAALLEERRGCEQANKPGRVAEIDKALRDLGATGTTPAKRASKRA